MRTPLVVLLVSAYCTIALGVYWKFPYILGTQKAIVLAAYLLLAMPAWFLCWRASTGLADGAARGAGLPDLPGLPVLLAASLAVLVGYAAFCNYGVELPDESVYQFQAQALRTGSLSIAGPSPAILADPGGAVAFQFMHTLNRNGRWFGKYPFGYPAVLAVAQSLNLDRFLNPVLGWLVIAVSAWIALDLYGTRVARWTVVVLALSPFFFFNAMGWYAHSVAAVLIAMATAACLRSGRSHGVLFLSLAGLAMSLCLLVRPFPVLIVTLVLAVYAIVEHWSRPRTLLAAGAVWGLFFSISITVYLYLQKQLTGSWFVSPYALYRGGSAVPGEINLHPASMLRSLVAFTIPGLLDTMLSAFPLVIPLALLGAVIWRDRRDRSARAALLLAALFWALVAGYIVQTESSTSSIGERYYFEGFFAAVILAVVTLERLLVQRARTGRPRKLAAFAIFAVAGVQILLYGRISHDAREPYRAMAEAARAVPETNGVVYLPLGNDRFHGPWLLLDTSGWQTAPVLYLKDPGAPNRDRVAHLLGRSRWVVLGWDSIQRRAVTLARSGSPP